MITPNEMLNGGILNGQQVDAVTCLLGALHAKFSALEEESRLTAMTEMLAFHRKHGESINTFLARYEVVRQRAAIECSAAQVRAHLRECPWQRGLVPSRATTPGEARSIHGQQRRACLPRSSLSHV